MPFGSPLGNWISHMRRRGSPDSGALRCIATPVATVHTTPLFSFAPFPSHSFVPLFQFCPPRLPPRPPLCRFLAAHAAATKGPFVSTHSPSNLSASVEDSRNFVIPPPSGAQRPPACLCAVMPWDPHGSAWPLKTEPQHAPSGFQPCTRASFNPESCYSILRRLPCGLPSPDPSTKNTHTTSAPFFIRRSFPLIQCVALDISR